MLAKALACQALDTVSFDRVAGCLDRYCGTESRVTQAGVDGQYRDKAVTCFDLAALEHLLVFVTRKQAAAT